MLIECALFYVVISNALCMDADVGRDPIELIKSRGFGVEIHNITTEDGYILGVHRIINPNSDKDGKSVILNHGLLMSGIDFINNSPGGFFNESLDKVGNNLGFELAKRGYDVWLVNNRGTAFSSNHVSLSRKDKAFWDFSYDEMAKFDLPATIEYVRKATSSETVAYVGHSQGTLIMFALLSEHPKYNDIVKPFIALAPVTTVSDMNSIFQIFAKDEPLMDILSSTGGSFLTSNLISFVAKNLCSSLLFRGFCGYAMFIAGAGSDSPQLDYARLPVYFAHTPGGTSMQNMVHWGQGVRTGRFAKFDYGHERNEEKYNSKVAPQYPLEKISHQNIALFSSTNDGLADVKDVQKLRERLTVPLLADYLVKDSLWTHFDFLWGKSSGDVVNKRVLDLLDNNA